MSEQMFERWQESVEVDVCSAAIRWKAEQQKDRRHIRSRHSEDALTWKVFRTIELEGRLESFVSDLLGLEDTDLQVLYWQRAASDSTVHPSVAAALRAFEPYHAASGHQHTETDLMIVGRRHLLMFENKLGWPGDVAAGWRRRDNDIRPEYRPHVEPFLPAADGWVERFSRYWQLLRNLALGRMLVTANDAWPGRGVHLVAVWNGSAYGEELASFRRDIVLPPDCAVHGRSWYEICAWAQAAGCTFVADRLASHPCLQSGALP